MRGLRLQTFGRTPLWGRVALAAAALVLAAPSGTALGQVTPTPPSGCWKLLVKPDSTSAIGGRLEFEELIDFQGLTFTGQEIARLGFAPGDITPGTNALGQTTFSVTLKSGTQGTVTASGVYLTTSMSGTFSWVRDGKTYT
jgi:hypothetical protein